MRNKQHAAALLAILTVISCISDPLFTVRTMASTRLTVTEGTGMAPDIQIIHTDENGNEITPEDEYDESTADGSSEDSGEESTKDPYGRKKTDLPVSKAGTYESDIRGTTAAADITELTDIYISSVDDLIALADNCSLDIWSRDKNVILKEDIDLGGSSFKYIPIFGGIFDGNGHTISGLYISSEESYTGLFCITQASAVIKNLTVTGSVMPSDKQLATGGIVGDNYGLISNCRFNGSVEGYDYTGGIAGYNEQTGTISSCVSKGHVIGRHFTGGITGYNLGIVNGCTNEARINITSMDETISFKDIDVSKYTNNLLNIFGDNNKQDSTSVLNSTVDIGGICGYSQGVIVSCTNESLVGYEHVGYNVGGIVGRQNGYVQMCVNNGEVFGRKDVGGIAGQAEPYVIIDITKDIVGQLTTNMNTLHDLVNVTLNDAGGESEIVSARLNMVKSFTDKALTDTSYLSNETEDWINGVMDSGTEITGRIDYALEEAAKSGGALDHTKQAADNASKAISNLSNAVNDLDIQKYLSPDESLSYNAAKQNIDKGTDEYHNLREKYYESDYRYNYYKFIDQHRNDPIYYGTSSNLVPLDVSGNIISWPSAGAGTKEEYDNISCIVHEDTSTDPPEYTDFPSSDEEYAVKDRSLSDTASARADIVVEELANEEFKNEHDGMSYPEWLEVNVETMAGILLSHEPEMAENTRRDIRYAVDSTKQSINNLGSAAGDVKSIVSDINSRGRITFPKLSDEYRNRSNSLIANIQGMSDNLGYLNNEMNSSNQQLVDDMIKVNDQFNVIMLLIADAIDGVLDEDYTDLYEDDSLSVADSSTDATIADSLNNGPVHGDINTAGIAGTMAIEYDFDLESDITGIRDAAAGTTYRSKCVLRNNKNNGYIEGLKSYIGGACGLQEMGTILRCQNYGKLVSKSGDYVGGISGKSLSTIKDCQAKCIMQGNDNIGGITGFGYDISGCYSLPSINSKGSCLGAIAGDNSQKGRLKSNYFVCDDHAGIDRVSYSGKAEPIPYEQLLSADGIPSEFRSIKVSFVVDDETISVKEYNYGDSITSLPIELTDDEYILWDWDNANLLNLHADSELSGTKARYITTLAGSQLRENGQSAVLADGKFISEDTLDSRVTGENEDPDIFECWELTIPEDFSDEHLIRYCPPENISDVRIWLLSGDEKTEAECQPMGKYYTFMAPGYNVKFLVENAYVSPIEKYAKYEIGGGAALLAAIMAILLHRNKNKKAKTGNKGNVSYSNNSGNNTDKAENNGNKKIKNKNDKNSKNNKTGKKNSTDIENDSDIEMMDL